MIDRIRIIANLTFRESYRKKIALTAVILGVAFFILFNLGFYFITIEAQTKDRPSTARDTSIYVNTVQSFMANYGLYAINFMIIVMATLVSADTLAGEIDSGVIQSITSKPIYRREIILGKFLGFASFLLAYLLIMAGGLILSVYFQTGNWVPKAIPGLCYMYLCSLIVLGTTLAFSSRISTLATGAAIFGLYGIAFIGGWVEQIGSFVQSTTAVNVGIISSLIMPTEAIWRKASFEMSSPLTQLFFEHTPLIAHSTPSMLMIFYGIIYMIASIIIAIREFEKRDL